MTILEQPSTQPLTLTSPAASPVRAMPQHTVHRMVPVSIWSALRLAPLMVPTGPDGLYATGSGTVDFECGTCRQLLARDVESCALRGAAVRCPSCRRWNRA